MSRLQMWLVMSAFSAILNACETVPKPLTSSSQSAQQQDALGLPPQELASGECAVFFWSKTEPRHFIFFHKQGDPTALLAQNGLTNTLHAQFAPRQFDGHGGINFQYKDDGGAAVSVKGIFGETLEGGRRLPNVAITLQNDDGWQMIVPASGVYVCR